MVTEHSGGKRQTQRGGPEKGGIDKALQKTGESYKENIVRMK